MSLREIFFTALSALTSHKLRSSLSSLGIIIGVAAVVATVNINEGMKRQTLAQIESLGTNNLRIKSVKPTIAKPGEVTNMVASYGLKVSDAEHIKNALFEDVTVIPIRDMRKKVYAGEQKVDLRVLATSPEFADVIGLDVDIGRLITHTDMDVQAQVCVLGSSAKKRLFGNKQCLGEYVNIGHSYFEVVGILVDRTTSPSGASIAEDLNNCVLIPFTTGLYRFGRLTLSGEAGEFNAVYLELDELILQFKSTEAVVRAVDAVKAFLSRTHPKADYTLIVPVELIKQKEEVNRRFTWLMIVIAAISLVVGGIGIMNIMLASVYERTREVGLRMSVGATPADIRNQFLLESVLICLTGSIVGDIIGVGFSYLGCWMLDVEIVNIAFAYTLPFIFSSAVGIIFGTYPAVKASHLNPSEALRVA